MGTMERIGLRERLRQCEGALSEARERWMHYAKTSERLQRELEDTTRELQHARETIRDNHVTMERLYTKLYETQLPFWRRWALRWDRLRAKTGAASPVAP